MTEDDVSGPSDLWEAVTDTTTGAQERSEYQNHSVCSATIYILHKTQVSEPVGLHVWERLIN